MKRAKAWPASRARVQAPNIVRELCDAIAAATRGDLSHAQAEIRRAVTHGAKLLSTGAIDVRGASLINAAAERANDAIRARPGSARDHRAATKVAEIQRWPHRATTINLSSGALSGIEDERFDAFVEMLSGGARKD
jgi:hypothetical protein